MLHEGEVKLLLWERLKDQDPTVMVRSKHQVLRGGVKGQSNAVPALR